VKACSRLRQLDTLCKHHATLSAAEGGCQAEIGVASSMAAALWPLPTTHRRWSSKMLPNRRSSITSA
jgi:hypothetical protein